YGDLIWDNLVKSWTVISVSTYNSVRTSNLTAEGHSKYRVPMNSNNILETVRNPSNCTLEEMDVNNDGVVSSSESCKKYYQYAYTRFIDMYAPTASDIPATAENDNRYTLVEYSRDTAMVDSDEQHNWRTSESQSGVNDVKLMAGGGFLAYQVANYTGKQDYAKTNKKTAENVVSLMCHEYENTGANSYFIPTKTDFEMEAFDKAVSSGNLLGVTVKECRRKFTEWYGTTTCPSLGCGETVTIAAERRCQRSSSAYGACSECDDSPDPAPIYNDPSNKCFFSRVCSGPPCLLEGADCLPAKAKILMADGSTKEIDNVKLGDKILGFSSQAPLAVPTPTKVRQIHVTNKAELMEINGLKVSVHHRMLKGDGQSVEAQHIRVGDTLIGTSGESIKVTDTKTLPEPKPVYNFVLEGADGYIVDGIRAMAVMKDE
ncbi:MAG: Hint domain-containing protein, partial [Bdellovibrionales bacterium]